MVKPDIPPAPPHPQLGTLALSSWLLRFCARGEVPKIVLGLFLLLLGSGVARLQMTIEEHEERKQFLRLR